MDQGSWVRVASDRRSMMRAASNASRSARVILEDSFLGLIAKSLIDGASEGVEANTVPRQDPS